MVNHDGRGRPAGPGVTVLIAVLIGAISAAGCGGDYDDLIAGLPAEQGYIAQGSDERATMGCLRQSIESAEALLRDPAVPDEDKERLRQSIRSARASLAHYDGLRHQGGVQAVAMGSIRTACAGVLADDVVGGFADDVLLIPLAFAALTTLILTRPRPSSDELSRAWDHVGRQVDELGTTVADIVSHMTAAGNVADTGIMAEVFEVVRRWGRPSDDRDAICRALQSLMEAADQANDNVRMQRIRATQKARKCRPSRHKRRL